MTINDLRMDIITTVSQLTDVDMLEKIQAEISTTQQHKNEDTPWKGAETELRGGASFDDLMREQQYRPITFAEFTHDPLPEDWAVSLDDLLRISSGAA